jgi:hypothetical protein
MAGQPGRSGGANGGPQYNPANVSATGGNGQSGQANPNYTGFGYGQNGALEAQAAGAKMEKAPTPSAAPAPAPASMSSMFGGLLPLDADSQDSLPISDGVDIGAGRGSEALPPSLNTDTRITENIDLMKKYLPDLLDAARLPGAPDSYKRLVNYVKARLI